MAKKLLEAVGLIGVAAVLAAPLAMARIPEPRPDSPPALPATAANGIYALGCADGTIPGPTGGDNNDYDYYANLCNLAATTPGGPSSTGGGLTAVVTAAAANGVYAVGCKDGTIPGATGGDNNDYGYYGNPCGP